MKFEDIKLESIADYSLINSDFAEWLKDNPEFKGGTIIKDPDEDRFYVLPPHYQLDKPIKIVFPDEEEKIKKLLGE